MSESKSYIRTLQNPDGTERIQFLGYVAKEGYSFYVAKMALKDEKFKVVSTGARAKFPSFDTVKAAVDESVKKAITKGWVVLATRKGPGPKADDFSLDNLPSPSKVEAATEETVIEPVIEPVKPVEPKSKK